MNEFFNKDYAFSRNRIGRIGVIDIGSNSIRLVVFGGFSRSPTYFFNEKVLCGLGKGLNDENKLNPLGKEKALKAIKRFMAISKKMNLTELVGVATAAVRNANDGVSFIKTVERETDLKLHVVSGREEAEFSANGVLLGWPDAHGVVCDIGGGSLELADVGFGKVGFCETSDLGALVLSDFQGSMLQLDTFIKSSVEKLCLNSNVCSKNIYLVGGSFRAFAKLDMALSSYPLRVLHEYKISATQAKKTASWIVDHDIDELFKLTGLSKERLTLLPMAARVLNELINVLKPEQVYFSSYGLREGILFYHMPKEIKKLDPLIEACRYQEQSSARFPGFGTRLYEWILPIFSNLDEESLKLYRAACLLHDTTWKAHPDYRAEMSFETVTRANLGGIDHKGRIFLAVALMSRYKKISFSKNIEGPIQILSASRSEAAIILGRAMRLGAMVSGTSISNLEKCKLFLRNKTIFLVLKKSGSNLAADTVERRLKTLANGMNMKHCLQIDK